MAIPLYAVYGNHLSFYGNIGLAQAPKPLRGYGAWPDDIPRNSPMVNSYPLEEDETPIATLHPTPSDSIAIIKRLRAELENTQDINKRKQLREQIEFARVEKVRAFQLAARIDEEESFILLH